MPIRIQRFLPDSILDRLALGRMFPDEASLAELEVKVADTALELEQAARLLHDVHVARGLIAPHPSGVRVTLQFLLPTTIILVAKQRGDVVGTLSLVLDASEGLPLDRVFGAELATLRARERKLIELAGLAVAGGHRRTGLTLLLYKLAYQLAREMLCRDDFVFAVHPDAEHIYRATLLCERIGPVCHYPGLSRNALAVLLRMDLVTARARFERAFGHRRKRADNPYHLFIEREFPQIKLPRSADFTERVRVLRPHATLRLLALRPDALNGLGPREVGVVHRALGRADCKLSATSDVGSRNRLDRNPYKG